MRHMIADCPLSHLSGGNEALHQAEDLATCTLRTYRILVLFCNTKHNVHRLTLNLQSLKIMMVESIT